MTLTRRQLLDLITAHGLRPSRALGQNFVVDPNTVRRIARLAEVGPGDRVVEVGPGLGSLTSALAETGASVLALEADRHLLPVLEAVVVDPKVRVVEADAMKADWPSLLGDEGGWVLVSNLPYNIATPLIADLLDQVPAIDRMLVMVQKEVGQRLVASVGDPAYGAVSVKVRYWAEARIAGDVPSTVFYPKPKVDSVLVSIRRRPVPALDPEMVDPSVLFKLVRSGFATRRKMLRRALSGTLRQKQFEDAGVASHLRAQELDLQAWGRLAAVAGAEPAPAEEPVPSPPEDADTTSPAPSQDADTTSPATPEPADSVESFDAPAKLTLSLRVVGVRPDGYHLIDAEMVTLDLVDTLEFSDGDEMTIEGDYGEQAPAGDDNLVCRALQLVGRRAAVRLHKRIPVGAGLGGGSADAAAVLRWAGVDDPELAAKLGADVPFCLIGGRARVTGAGEQVDPLPIGDLAGQEYTLLTPPFGVSTAEVYAAWDRLGGPTGERGNDLEPAALAVEPRLAEWRDALRDATGQEPFLAGSGGTWYVPGAYPGDGRLVVRVAEANG